MAQNFFPNFQVAGDVGLAVGIQLKPSDQQHEPWIRPKDGPGSARRNVFRAEGFIETV